MLFIQHYDSPLGGVLLAADNAGLTGLWFNGAKYFAANLPEAREEKRTPILDETARWLDIYFAGGQPDFTPPLHLIGSDFRRRVWKRLLEIPVWADDDIRRAAGRRHERAGCRRRGWTQPDFHHCALSSRDRRKRQPDGLCGRHR